MLFAEPPRKGENGPVSVAQVRPHRVIIGEFSCIGGDGIAGIIMRAFRRLDTEELDGQAQQTWGGLAAGL